jgi:glycosyltransferase involved in cell wall biosynthesis
MTDNKNIKILDIQEVSTFSHSDPEGVAIIMPCTDVEEGQKTAEVLHRRAQMPCTIIVVMDTLRQGFIKTLNQTAARISARYIVYLAQDAWPGRGWLKCAFDSLEKSGKGLLAFNDGKWSGHIASFGMVRTSWLRDLYNGDIFYSGYHSHAADNELTVIARVQDMHVYNPECTLVEHDPDKDFGGSNPVDRKLFEKRFFRGFDGLVPLESLKPLAEEYKVNWEQEKSARGVSIIILTLNAAHHLDRLLSTFLNTNTHKPVELIIIDHGSSDNTAATVSRYIDQGVIRLVSRGRNYSFSESCNLGAELARYSNLLFLNNDIVYTKDILLRVVEVLEKDEQIGAVDVQLGDRTLILHRKKLFATSGDYSKLDSKGRTELDDSINSASGLFKAGQWSRAADVCKSIFQAYSETLPFPILLKISQILHSLDAFPEAWAALQIALKKDPENKSVLSAYKSQYYYHAYSSWLMETMAGEAEWYKADGLPERPDWNTAVELCKGFVRPGVDNPPGELRQFVQAGLLLAEECRDKNDHQRADEVVRDTMRHLGAGWMEDHILPVVQAIRRVRTEGGEALDAETEKIQKLLAGIPADLLSVQGWLSLNDILNWNGLLRCGLVAQDHALAQARKQGDSHPKQADRQLVAARAALD